jgi:hypothetical protein
MSSLSEGTRILKERTLPVRSLRGLVITNPSLKTLSTFVEYSKKSEPHSKQQKLPGIAD